MRVLSVRLDLNQRPPVSEAGTLNQLSYWLTEPSLIDKVERVTEIESARTSALARQHSTY